LPSARQIARLQGLSNRVQGFGNRTVAAELAGCGLRQGNEVRLRLRQISGLQVLTQLFEFAPNLLVVTLNIGKLRKAAAGDSGYGHICLRCDSASRAYKYARRTAPGRHYRTRNKGNPHAAED